MKIRNFFKVGKELSIRMTGRQNSVKFNSLNKNEETNNDVCANCILHIKDESEKINTKTLKYKEEYCFNYCKRRKNHIKEKELNDDNFLGVVDKRLSRLQLCQNLLYQALDVNLNGIIKDVSESEVASLLGCTIRTVRNNNKRLSELNYIQTLKTSKDTFNVLLLDYNKYHLSTHDGGRGYIVMSNKTLIKLLNIENVNSLRIAIRNLIKFDDSNIKRIKTREVSYTYDEASFFLPNYINHKAIINKMLEETFSMFNYRKENEKIYFKIKDEYDGKKQRRKLENKYRLYIKNYCQQKYFNLTNKDYDDLVQMSLEYRFNTVIDTLNLVYTKYYLKNITVENYCGLVREIIKNTQYKKIAA